MHQLDVCLKLKFKYIYFNIYVFTFSVLKRLTKTYFAGNEMMSHLEAKMTVLISLLMEI